MFSRIHRRLGSAGLLLSILAIVLALGGTALAASGALTSKQKREVTKIARQFAGHDGAAGALGPIGPPGPKGDPGASGSPGKDGTFSTEPLPSKQTLAGVWAVSGAEGKQLGAISFPIEVTPAPITLIQGGPGASYGLIALNGSAHFYPNGSPSTPEEIEQDEDEWEADCPGSSATPTAAPGFLCVYVDSTGGTSGPTPGTTLFEAAHTFGVNVPMQLSGAGDLYVRGTWAVTAE